MSNVKVAIVYHSGYGHTAVIAESVKTGVETENASAQLISISPEGKITDAEWQLLSEADAVIFGAPTYMGSASGQFKLFADATSRFFANGAMKDKIAGGFTVSGSMSGDKLATLQQLSILAAQHGMVWVSLGLPPLQSPETPHQRPADGVNRVGSFLGVMAQAENASAETTPPSGDRKTAELYGARIAQAAKRWKN